MKTTLLFTFTFISYLSIAQETWRTELRAKHPSGNYVDANGNVYGIGNKDYAVSPSSLKDVFLFKLDANGDSLWVAAINGLDDYQDAGGQIAVDTSGNIYITGTLINDTVYNWDKDVMVAKFDANGNQLWQYDYNGSADHVDIPYTLLITPDQQVVVGATTRELNGDDITLFKLDDSGVLAWKRHYDNSASTDLIKNMVLDTAGNIVVLGSCVHDGSAAFAPAIISYDQSGNMLSDTVFLDDFTHQYASEHHVVASDMDENGTAYFYTYRINTFSNFVTEPRVVIANVNSITAIDTLRRPDDIDNSWSFGANTVVKADHNGDLLIGSTLAMSFSDKTNYFAKFLHSGTWAFKDTFGLIPFSSDETMFNIEVNSANEIFVAADRSWFSGGYVYYEMLVRKYTSAGAPVKEHTILGFEDLSGGNYRDQSQLTFDSDDNPILTINTGQHQITTLKLDTSLFSEIGGGITTSIIESVNGEIHFYPNPTHDQLFVTMNYPTNISYSIFSLDGRVIKQFSAKKMLNTTVDLSDQPSGVYILSVKTEKGTSTHKIMKR